MSSVHNKLKRVRRRRSIAPLAFIDSDGTPQQIPFVIGAMADLGGDTDDGSPLEDRDFHEIDRDNFDDVMKRQNPSLNLQVANTVAGDCSEIHLSLQFPSMDDFSPERIARKMEPLDQLLETRRNLHLLLKAIEQEPSLAPLLQEIVAKAASDKAS